MAQSDAREIDQEGKEHPKRRFDARDWRFIAEMVVSEWSDRKSRRADRERCWKDIDRQIAMQPEVSFKKLPDGRIDKNKAWMAEVELPLQAQALEVLTADARRMQFPDSGPWFRAHAEMTDEYLASIDYQSIILGDEAEVPSQINQDNADKLAEGFLLDLFRKPIDNEDFFTRQDKINAESFKYGCGVGRARMFKRDLYTKLPNGVRRETRKVPVLMPCSIRNLYLDDRKPSMHSAQLMEPAHIACDRIRLENLQIAASRGSADPDDDDGGWMPKNLAGLVGDEQGYVTLLEMEGDIVVPRKTTRSVLLPNAIVTVALGGKEEGSDNTTKSVVRFRWRQSQHSSYLLFPYHYEGADDVYPASPLMKGRPVQIMCTDALNRLLDSAMLKNAPPVGYDRTDQTFAQAGGPQIFPYAQWGTSDPSAIKAYVEVGGDPAALAAVMARGIALYAELTGVLPARLGAQTTSHTTAFAKDAELQRGAVRTVDYVRQVGQGPMTRWLQMAYEMGRNAIGNSPVAFWIGAYGGYVEVTKDQLPPRATFEWFGSGGPDEEREKQQRRIQSMGLAFQIDQAAMQTGRPPTLKPPEIIAEVLREGGWTDVDPFIERGAPLQAPQQLALPLPAPAGAGPVPDLADLTGIPTQ